MAFLGEAARATNPLSLLPLVAASSPEGGAFAWGYPFRLAVSRQATFPKGTAFGGSGKVPGIVQRRPLEERLPPLRGKMSPQVTKGGIWHGASRD